MPKTKISFGIYQHILYFYVEIINSPAKSSYLISFKTILVLDKRYDTWAFPVGRCDSIHSPP